MVLLSAVANCINSNTFYKSYRMPLKTIYFFLIYFFCLAPGLCFAQQPNLVVPVGHTDIISNAKFSADGTTVATVSIDKTVKLWDIPSGRLLQTFNGHKSFITNLEFSSKGNYLLTGSKEDSSNRVWDLHSGKQILQLKRVPYPDIQIRLSKDEKYAVAHDEKGISVWNILTGRQTDSFRIKDQQGADRFIYNSALSNDGKMIAGDAGNYGGIVIWNVANHYLIKKINVKSNYEINELSFSADNTLLYISTKGKFIIVDIYTGKIKFRKAGYSTQMMAPKISKDGHSLFIAGYDEPYYRVVKGDTMMNEDYGKNIFQPSVTNLLTNKTTLLKGETPPGWINKVKVDEQGNLMAVFASEGLYIYKVVGDKMIKQNFLTDTTNEGYNKPIDLSADFKFLVAGNKNNSASLYNINGKLLHTLSGSIAFDSFGNFSDDGNYIFTSSGNQNKYSWDITAGKISSHYDTTARQEVNRQVKEKNILAIHDTASAGWKIVIENDTVTLQGQKSKFLEATLSNSGNYIITTFTGDSLVKIWDAHSGKLVKQSASTYGDFSKPVLSNDDRFIATLVSNVSNQLDLMWANLQKEIDGDTSSPTTMAAYPNEIRVLAFPSLEQVLLILDTSAYYDFNVSFSDAAKFFSVTGNKLGIWDTKSRQQILSVANNCAGSNYSWAISTDGKMILVSCNNNSTLYETYSNKLLSVLPGAVRFANFSSDGKRIVTQSDDRQLKIWNTLTGKLLYTYYAFEKGNYIVRDNFDRYDGTEEARKKLYYVCGNEFIDLEQFKDQLWVPNLAERIMNGDSINAPKLSDLNICGLTPEVENKSIGTTEYYFKITPRRGGLGETVLFVNGIEAKRYKPEQLKKNVASYDLVIKKEELNNFFVAGKENPVTLKAYTAGNTISSRGVILLEDKTKQEITTPNLYAVMVGVSDYKGDELDLKYAAKDATDISNAVANAAKKLLNSNGKEHVFMYNLTTAKDHYQLPEKNSIKNVLEEIGKKATANDILMIFFAGHGVMQGEKKQFYFLTADASKSSFASAVTDAGISTTELTEWMKPQNIKAQKRILIFDACNSGQAIKDFVKMGNEDQNYLAARNDDKAQQIKALDKLNEKSGLFILSASASNQSAYEMGRYSQGLLTYALLKAIKQQPDILEEGKYLNVSRWFNAAEKTVSDLSKENGARQEPQIVSNTNFNIGMVDEEVMATIVLPQEKPLFAASNFQNSDEAVADDDLELSKLINLQLNDIAARGTDSKIVYVTATNSPDAYSLSGRYTIKGNAIRVIVNIKQNKIIISKFEWSGTKEKLSELATEIADKAAGIVK